MRELPKSSDWVFITRQSERLRDIRTAWLNALAKSGIGHCRFHDLRHTRASEMGEHTDLKTLMEPGGWKRPQIPMHDVHPSVDHKRNGLQRLVEKGKNVGMRAKVIELAG